MNKDKIMKRYIAALTTLILVSLPDRAKAQGNLLFNGGFDTNAAGWTLSDGSFFISTFGKPSGCVRLDNARPSPSLTPSASQTVGGLVPGAIYTVSGDYLVQGKNYSSAYSFGVTVDGVFLFHTEAPTDYNWYRFNSLYTATSSSAVLGLSSRLNGTGIPYIIDNIAMQVVPEPSSLWLALAGGLVCVLVYRGRRNC